MPCHSWESSSTGPTPVAAAACRRPVAAEACADVGGPGSAAGVARHAGHRARHPARLRPARPPPTPRALAAAGRRTWRMADVVAAISGGPRARMLIEAASRPGPVEPGSLLEAVKALRPAPTLPESTRTV